MRYVVTVILALLCAATAIGAEHEPLDILVYGATGKVGSKVVAEALDRGHHVTAVSRDPSGIEPVDANLTAVKGDLLDSESIARLAQGQDVIVVAVRGIIGKSKTPESALQLIAVKKIVEVLRTMGEDAPRLIHVGGSGSLEVEPGVYYADKLPKLFLPKKLELEIQGQVLALEYLRGVDDVRWTYATPAKNFTNGKRTGVFRIGGDQLMEDDHGRSRISRADFAVALLDEAECGRYINKRFSVAY